MTINVTNCGDCIFRIHHVDYNSMGHDTIDSCELIQHLRGNYVGIAVYDSYNEEEIPELKTTLLNCPLKEQEIIVKLNV